MRNSNACNEDAAVVAVPEDGREYRVVIGRSLTSSGGSGGVGSADGGAEQDEHGDASENHIGGGASAMMMALRQQSNKRIKTAGGVTVPVASTSQHDGAREMCVSFRYEFQPASVDKSMPGLVTMDESNGLQVLRGNSTGAPGGILFKGKAIENKEIDCLLIFDGTCFRLERCPTSYTQLRHVRAPPARRPVVVRALPDPTTSSATHTAASAFSSTATTAPAAPGSAVANTSATESPPQVTPVSSGGRGRGRGSGRGRGRGRGRGAKQPAALRATTAAKPAVAVAPRSSPPARQPRNKPATENASEQS